MGSTRFKPSVSISSSPTLSSNLHPSPNPSPSITLHTLIMFFVLLQLILFTSLFTYLLFRRANKPRLRRPPGPDGLPFIGNLHQIDTSATHIYLLKLSKKYGPLMSMKFGTVPVLVVSSPETAKQVFKTHDLAFSSRPRVLGLNKLSYNGLDVAFAPYGESWRESRKICVLHLLSNRHVQSFKDIREEEVFRMIKGVSAAAKLGQEINLTVAMMSMASTLICRIAFGLNTGSQFRRFDELMIEAQAIQGGFFISDYLPLFGWLDKVTGMIGKLDKVCKNLDDFYNDLISNHVDRTSSHPNILNLLIRIKEDKSCSIDLTWNHVKAILMNIFIAGTDTSAATLVWTMTALMQSPDVMKKLQNDVRNLVGDKDKVNESDLPNLPYLKAVVKESLRLYPPAPLLLPRETIEKCEVQGYTIPPKTTVYINAWAIARDPDYWESPDEFVPERFLNTNVDIMGQDFHVIPFGSGRRGCPGIAMGLANVELALANLVYLFNWELTDGMTRHDIDTQVLPGLTMHKKNPLRLVPKKYHT